MHVLIIPSWYPAFPEDINGSFFREQTIALKRNNINVGVIHTQFRSLKNIKSLWKGKWGCEKVCDEGVVTYRWHNMNWFPRTPSLKQKQIQAYGLKLFDIYVNENGLPDVIHVHSILYGASIAQAIRDKYNIPYLITEHSSAYLRNTLTSNELKQAKILASKAEYCLAVSEGLANVLNQKISREGKKWIVLPNSVNNIFFENEIRSNSNKLFKFIHVSLLSENKRVDIIVRSFFKLKKIINNVQLTIVGDGPEKKNLINLTKNLDLGKNVKFLGKLNRESVMYEMSESDCFVLASEYETFGVVLIEAMALGKPIIATKSGGPEYIVTEDTGILVEVDNDEEMLAAMLEMVINKEIFHPEKIRKRCELIYSEKVVIKRLLEIYSKVSKSIL